MAKTSGSTRKVSSISGKVTKESLNSAYKKETGAITSKYVKELGNLMAQEIKVTVQFENMVKGNHAPITQSKITSTPKQDAWLKGEMDQIKSKQNQLEKQKDLAINATFQKYKALAKKHKLS